MSGGADSTALAVLAVAHGLDATLVHVDHGLRPGSEVEARMVAALAAALGARFRSERITVTRGSNLEARAREARYAVLASDVLTGHTADDQAETVLVNLLRGAGLSGLAGMRPGVRRPLLALRRSETAALCADLGLRTVIDPSNDDRRFLRNRVRHELLPLMAKLSGRDPVPILVRQADVLRVDADGLEALACALDPTDARALVSAPPALARRAVRRWLTTTHPPDAATVERVLAVARGEARACEVGRGVSVRRTAQRLRLEPAREAVVVQ